MFVINLIFPVFLGLTETEGNGRYGMMVGIVLCWFIGLVVCACSRLLGTALRWGALFVAFNQLIPVLQMCAGSYAMSIGSQFKSHPQFEYLSLNTFISGFIATVITGGILMIVALMTGLLVLGLSYLADNNNIAKKSFLLKAKPG